MRRILILSLLFVIACNILSRPPSTDPFEVATQIALTGMPTNAQATLLPTIEATPSPSPTPDPAIPSGRIVYVCQVFKVQYGDQICIMNADGTGQHRLTTEDYTRHFYPSLAPDSESIVYAQFGGENIYDIYEMTRKGKVTQLTDGLGILLAPEISPDGSQIVFTHDEPLPKPAIWVMNRDGSNPHQLYESGWDPTWSPDGEEILFASDIDGTVQLYILSLKSGITRQVSAMSHLRGRSDWSPLGEIVTYSGTAWHRELVLMNADGSNPHQITPKGGNSQGASLSPDGNWVAFTAYFDHYDDIHGCEIYIMRTDGSDLRRLTDNDYCDWQPRWGP